MTEDSSKPIVAMPHPTHHMNGRLVIGPLVKLSAVWQTLWERTNVFPDLIYRWPAAARSGLFSFNAATILSMNDFLPASIKSAIGFSPFWSLLRYSLKFRARLRGAFRKPENANGA